MPSKLLRLLAFAGVLLASATASAQPVSVGPSGLPLPRFVSLAEPEVNARTGPGREYPIRWLYLRRDLPGYEDYCRKVRYRLFAGLW